MTTLIPPNQGDPGTGASRAGQFRLSPATVVWVTADGVVVPRLDAPPELHFADGRPGLDRAARAVPVGRARLEALVALAASAGDPAAAVRDVADRLAGGSTLRADLAGLVAALDEAGLLPPIGAADAGPDDAATLPPPSPATTADRTAVEGTGDSAHRPDAEEAWLCPVPLALAVADGSFAWLDHDERVLASLDPVDVVVLAAFAGGRSSADAHDRISADPYVQLDADELGARVGRLAAAGILQHHQPASGEALRQALTRKFTAYNQSDQALRDVLGAEEARSADRDAVRPVVVPVDAYGIPMLSLGMVVAYARQHRGGALQDDYAFAPLWYTRRDRFQAVLDAHRDQPAVFLFSHYTWTEQENLALSAAIKALMPRAITVHGGPNVPKYPGDSEAWFARHPHVDVAVHGEGEETLAELLDALAAGWGDRPDGPPSLDRLAAVPGLTFRRGPGVRRTADRERIADLDTLPSPYLTGLFEHRDRWEWSAINLETNRGCPYGCTFCDWGSATLSRIRKFSMDRVTAEMEWAARHGFEVFSLTDANFGIFERDADIARWAVELNARYGYPTAFQVNYAKNRVANLAEIVKILADAGILTEGLVAVQTFDPVVLKTIKRSNIKQERYDALTEEFRQAGLPLYTDVIVGLPGSTVDTVRNDLQGTVDRELHAKTHPTQLLVNSPMNEPAYREAHGIVASPGEHLEQAATYTHDDWVEMMAMRRFFYFAERRGILRQVATYTRVETGIRETDFYDRVRQAGGDPHRWPYLAYTTRVAPDEYVPPGSWRPLLDELRRFCVTLGVPDDAALTTVLRVQHAVIPARGRTFPDTLELDHDYAAWHRSVVDAKRDHGPEGWPDQVTRLRLFGPGRFTVEDRDDCCGRVMGQNAQGGLGEVIWELDSPVTRPKQLA